MTYENMRSLAVKTEQVPKLKCSIINISKYVNNVLSINGGGVGVGEGAETKTVCQTVK